MYRMSTKSEIVIKGELIPVYASDNSGVVEVYLTILNARGRSWNLAWHCRPIILGNGSTR